MTTGEATYDAGERERRTKTKPSEYAERWHKRRESERPDGSRLSFRQETFWVNMWSARFAC